MEKEILNMQEVCELLDVSEKTMIKLLKDENIPARKIGREWRFSKDAIIKWIATGNSIDYNGQEDESNTYEKETNKIIEVLDRLHDRINSIRTNLKQE